MSETKAQFGPYQLYQFNKIYDAIVARRCKYPGGLARELPKPPEPTGDPARDARAILNYEERPRQFIYAIKCCEFIKLGRTRGYSTVAKRLLALQTASPHQMEILHQREVFDSAREEGWMHERYAEYRQTGEWFRIPDDKLADLKKYFETNSLVSLQPLSPKQEEPRLQGSSQ